MSPEFLILCFAFAALIMTAAPIACVIALSSAVAILATGRAPAEIVATSMAHGVDSFALLAIPFFILSGMIMGRGSMAMRLIEFAGACLARFPGALAYVNTLACMFFGAISGSSAAAVSSIGSFLIPQMDKKGYGKDFAVALTVTSSTTGMLIPPSNTMIVYSVAAGGVSIGALFMAGVLPGILFGIGMMCVSLLYVRKRGFKAEGAFDLPLIWRTFKRAFLSLMLIVVILGGILGGVFTATEAAAISVAYALLLEVVIYRELSAKEIFDILTRASTTTAVIMLIVGASTAMSWIMTMTNAPQQIAEGLLWLASSKVALLLIINFILLLVGTFMDMTPAILIFTPIFLPISRSLGIDDIHFGIIMIANLSIGLCTPPVGTCLFVGCSVGNTDIGKVSLKLIPYVISMIISLLIITYIPWLSLALPELLGLK